MIDPNQKFEVPLAFFYQKIDVETRKKLFTAIVEGFTREFNTLKFIGAYLNWDVDKKYDYIAMYETTNTRGMPFILYAVGFFGDRHSIQGFYYCLTHDLIKEFFEDSFVSMVPLEKKAFENVIMTLGFTLTKTNENPDAYYKKAENMKVVAEHLKNIGIYYTPQMKV